MYYVEMLLKPQDIYTTYKYMSLRAYNCVNETLVSLCTVLVPYAEDLNELSDSLLEQLNARSTHGHPFHKIDNPHISLTRTLKLRHHWLNDLSQSLENMAALFRRSDFNCSTRVVCSIHITYLPLMLCSIHTIHPCLMLCMGFSGHCCQSFSFRHMHCISTSSSFSSSDTRLQDSLPVFSCSQIPNILS